MGMRKNKTQDKIKKQETRETAPSVTSISKLIEYQAKP